MGEEPQPLNETPSFLSRRIGQADWSRYIGKGAVRGRRAERREASVAQTGPMPERQERHAYNRSDEYGRDT